MQSCIECTLHEKYINNIQMCIHPKCEDMENGDAKNRCEGIHLDDGVLTNVAH